MKRKLAIVILINFLCVVLLSSCSGGSMLSKILGNKEEQYFNNEQAQANAQMDKVLEAIKNKDKIALKSLFSPKAIAQTEDIDQSIIDLFDYFQGDFVLYNDWGGPATFRGINDDGTGRNWKSMESSYDVETSKQKYRFAIQDFIQDTADTDNVGIHSLYIIKMEDDTDINFAYWGDGKDTPGINIGIKNVLPKEDDSINAVSVDD